MRDIQAVIKVIDNKIGVLKEKARDYVEEVTGLFLNFLKIL